MIINYVRNSNRVPIIIIDEAHLLKNENYFELQIITNFNMDSLDPALIILSAQSHLNDRLSRSILESFNQRINMKFHFKPLSPCESEKYIAHSLSVVGGNPEIFTNAAYKALYNLSRILIRKI